MDAIPAILSRPIIRQLAIDSTYVLIGFPLAITSFVVAITGLSVGIGMLVTVVGLPILGATLYAARLFADVERLSAAKVMRQRLPRPAYRQGRPTDGWWRRSLRPLGDPQSWFDLLQNIVVFPVATVTFVVVITWWAVALAGVTYIAWFAFLPPPPDDGTLADLLGFSSPAADVGINLLLGIVFAVTLVPVVRGCALLQAGLNRALLSTVAELQHRITGLEAETSAAHERTASAEGRTKAAVSAEATALRRLERDIHDGPQQRLVRLAMDLGRAQHQLDNSDADAARETVGEAIAQARETLDELRALSRGIAPPILVDRGLTAALAALAARGTVPIDIEAAQVGRLPTLVESTAYFVVAESLTNVAKHSRATECRIRLSNDSDSLTVEVTDDGIGGAHVAKGHGLAGLDDRVRSAGGTLTIDSSGTGTTVLATLPLNRD